MENAQQEEELDIESMTDEQRKKLLDVINSGGDTVDFSIPTKAAEPVVGEPAAEGAGDPAPVVPPVEEPKGETPPVDKPKRPDNLQDALAQLNTERQKREARERLLERIGKDPEFASTYLKERGFHVQFGQDARSSAQVVAHSEAIAEREAENLSRQNRELMNTAVTHADEILPGFEVVEPVSVADAKWLAVCTELGNDPAKMQQYVSDPEFRKTVKAEGPKDVSQHLKVANAIRSWMNDPERRDLQAHLTFSGIPRKAQQQAAPKQGSVEDLAARAEAERLAAKGSEPTTIPTTASVPNAGALQAVEELLAKAERVGVDNLSKEEIDRIHRFYA